MFAVVALCFLLPFAGVSCRDDLAEGFGSGGSRNKPVTYSGIDLVRGKTAPQEVDSSTPAAETPFRSPAEPMAIVAFAAIALGIPLSFVDRYRYRIGLILALVALASIGLLASSPTLARLGFLDVHYRYGYWVTLGLLIMVTGMHIWLLREPPTAPNPSGTDPTTMPGAAPSPGSRASPDPDV